MLAHRMSMRKPKEVLRSKWVCGQSHRQIIRAIGIGVAPSRHTLHAQARPASTGLLSNRSPKASSRSGWTCRRKTAAPTRRVERNYAAMHRDLRRKGVTLQLL